MPTFGIPVALWIDVGGPRGRVLRGYRFFGGFEKILCLEPSWGCKGEEGTTPNPIIPSQLAIADWGAPVLNCSGVTHRSPAHHRYDI